MSEDRVEHLERQVQRASLFTHASLDRLVGRISGAESYLMEVVDLLRRKGVIDEADLAPDGEAEPEPDTEIEPADPNGRARWSWPSIAFGVEPEEQQPEGEVDCASRMHVCKAVCCRLSFALTAGEVESGSLKWDLGFPYLIRQEADGDCSHHDRQTGRCGVYANRPGVCRRYTCRDDPRIWKDFDQMELNTEWIEANLSGPRRITLRAPLPLMEVPASETTK